MAKVIKCDKCQTIVIGTKKVSTGNFKISTKDDSRAEDITILGSLGYSDEKGKPVVKDICLSCLCKLILQESTVCLEK